VGGGDDDHRRGDDDGDAANANADGERTRVTSPDVGSN
jgi:hypothetical protein